jgi:hypothetical protein
LLCKNNLRWAPRWPPRHLTETTGSYTTPWDTILLKNSTMNCHVAFSKPQSTVY